MALFAALDEAVAETRAARQERDRQGVFRAPRTADALPSFLCPIFDAIMRDPVFAADGHTYERAAIEEWLVGHDTSPKTGARLERKNLTPNIALRNAIEEWEENYAMHIRRANIELAPQAIASGSFKTVFKGSVLLQVEGCDPRRVTAAVLKMRRGDIATEARFFLKLGRHPRLVRFLGQCIDDEDHFLLTEFAEMGSLSDAFERLEDQITLAHQTIIMQQIAQAMEHLIGAGVVHRDLAARNVLLFCFEREDVRRTSVKVSDYGLAVGVYNNTHVTVARTEQPTRYMPPESLQKNRFSEKSDVWAFGVTCWEILTMGNVPHFELSDSEVIKHVCGGGRLQRDQITGECPDALWDLIASCWATLPKDRSCFAELVIAFGAMHKQTGMKIHLRIPKRGTITINAQATDSVDDFKRKVQAIEPVASEQLRFERADDARGHIIGDAFARTLHYEDFWVFDHQKLKRFRSEILRLQPSWRVGSFGLERTTVPMRVEAPDSVMFTIWLSREWRFARGSEAENEIQRVTRVPVNAQCLNFDRNALRLAMRDEVEWGEQQAEAVAAALKQEAAFARLLRDEEIALGEAWAAEDRATLEDHQVTNGSTLLVIEEFDIFVEDLMGESIRLKVSEHDSVKRLKDKYRDETGTPPDQQRMIFSGKILEDGRKLSAYGVSKESRLHVVLRLMGDIGEWGEHVHGAGTRFLMGDKATAQDARLVLQDLGVTEYRMFERCDEVVLEGDARRRLMQHADERKVAGQTDLKLTLSLSQLQALIPRKALRRLDTMFKRFGGAAYRVCVRRVEPVREGLCINFHTDSTLRTMQVPLNDESEYEGGRLVFATWEGLVYPRREAGTCTLHDCSIVHGVSQHTRGVRYSLFLLETPVAARCD